MNKKTKKISLIVIAGLTIIILIFLGIKFFSNKNIVEENIDQTPKRHVYTKEEKLDILNRNKPKEELTAEKKKELVEKLDTMMEENKKASALDKLNANKTADDEALKLEKLDLLKNQ